MTFNGGHLVTDEVVLVLEDSEGISPLARKAVRWERATLAGGSCRKRRRTRTGQVWSCREVGRRWWKCSVSGGCGRRQSGRKSERDTPC